MSTLRKDRERVRQLVGYQGFIDINNRCPIEVCESRDTKGLYKRARRWGRGIHRHFVSV